MSLFLFVTDKNSEEFCLLIAHKMVELFGISKEEAIGRINRDWKGQEIVGMDVIYHEDEEYWAKEIYYGHDSRWWKGETGLKPSSYP